MEMFRHSCFVSVIQLISLLPTGSLAQSARPCQLSYECTPEHFRTTQLSTPAADRPQARTKARHEFWKPLELYYATNRRVQKRYLMSYPPNYSAAFTDELTSVYTYGMVWVTVPGGRPKGDRRLGSDTVISSRSPRWNFFMFAHQFIEQDEFPGAVLRATSASTRKTILFYVHGIRTSFELAGETTAQIHDDTAFEGVPIFISWPAADPFLYTAAEYRRTRGIGDATVNLVRPSLEALLDLPNAVTHIVAHSQGAEILVQALNEFNKTVSHANLGSIVFAAAVADVDQSRKWLFPTFRGAERIIVNYCTRKDLALQQARRINGTNPMGDCSSSVPQVAEMETIVIEGAVDAKDWFAHSYFLVEPRVLKDIEEIIVDGKKAPRRSEIEPHGAAWIMRLPIEQPPAPAGGSGVP
jgi:esterase/lipase superfamily enzyme